MEPRAHNVDMEERERAALCALNRIFGFEPRTGHALLEAFGSASAAFDAGPAGIAERMGPYNEVACRLSGSEIDRSAEELGELEGLGARFVPFGSGEYPARLAECPDAPLGLYVKGDAPLAVDRPEIAFVGTRDLTSYGRYWCQALVEALSRARIKPRIVSGLALGADVVAHLTALENDLPTVAVMATGVDAVYPAPHMGVAARIAAAGQSALVSDYPLRTMPVAVNFVRRNRIIAGLSDATVVIESKIKGGSLITARFAFDYDREVYVLPGRVDDKCSRGCNRLILSEKAHPIESAEMLVEALGLGFGSRRRRMDLMEEIEACYAAAADARTIGQLQAVAGAVKGQRGISVEDLALQLDMEYPRALALSSMLETDGFITTDLLQRCSIVYSRPFSLYVPDIIR